MTSNMPVVTEEMLVTESCLVEALKAWDLLTSLESSTQDMSQICFLFLSLGFLQLHDSLRVFRDQTKQSFSYTLYFSALNSKILKTVQTLFEITRLFSKITRRVKDSGTMCFFEKTLLGTWFPRLQDSFRLRFIGHVVTD